MPVTSDGAVRPTSFGAAAIGLTPAVLLGLVDDVASARPLWSHLVAHNPDERSTLRLIATDLYEVWLLGWAPGQQVELHDHGPSHAAFRVVEGNLTELEPNPPKLRRRLLTTGSRRMVPSGTVHDVLNDSLAMATSIHAYSPPLSAMTFYDATATQVVRAERVEPIAPVLDSQSIWPVTGVPHLVRQ